MVTYPKDKARFPAADNLKAIRKTSLYVQIASQIQELIENGKLKHGDQLPPERELADIFQVSRHSVREAIRTLEQKNILKSRVGSGTYVVIEDEPSVVSFLAEAIQREKGKLSEIFEFRRMIEPQIARLAAQNATLAHLAQLADILTNHEKDMADLEKSVEWDHAFHSTLALATGNEILLKIVERTNDILGESRADVLQSMTRVRRSINGHRKLLEALRHGDPDRAAQAMTEHLTEVEEVIRQEQR